MGGETVTMTRGITRLSAWMQGQAWLTALAVIVLAAGTPFLDGLLTGRMYTGCAGPTEVHDSCIQFEPWMAQALRAIRSGELPLWNP